MHSSPSNNLPETAVKTMSRSCLAWALDPYKNHTEVDAETAGTTILNRVSGGAGVFVRKASSGDVVTTFVSRQILVSCLVSVTVKRD